MTRPPIPRIVRAATAVVLVTTSLAGCTSPLDDPAAAEPGAVDRLRADDVRRGRDETVSLPDAPAPEDWVRLALERSPEVAVARAHWEAARARAPQVGALPDPQLTLGVMLDEVETRTGPQQGRVGLRQPVPWPGRLDARTEAAEAAARAALEAVRGAELSVRGRVLAQLHELAWRDAATTLARDTLGLLRELEAILRARYRVAAASHPDVVRVQVELGLVEDRIAGLEALRPVLAAELNALVDRDAAAAVPSVAPPAERVARADAATLVTRALDGSPELAALEARLESERALVAAARTEGRPDFVLGLDWILTGDAPNPSITESGDDPVMLSVGVTLPIFRERVEAGVREALARRLATAGERRARAAALEAAVRRAWFEHADAHRRAVLHERTLIPKAEESLSASLAAFRAGESPFLDVLDAERTQLELALALARARADRGRALARLETLVGAPLETDAVPAVDPEARP